MRDQSPRGAQQVQKFPHRGSEVGRSEPWFNLPFRPTHCELQELCGLLATAPQQSRISSRRLAINGESH